MKLRSFFSFLLLGFLLMNGSISILAQDNLPYKYFFVSPEGLDANTGEKHSPVLTFEAAQRLVREFKLKNNNIPVTVFFRGGSYYRNTSVVFTSNDSGSEVAPVVYCAYPGEKPVILGSIPLHLSWKKYKNGIYKAEVPKGLIFESLFINDEQQVLARYPNYDKTIRTFGGTAADCISPERVKRWKNPEGGYFHVIHKALWGGFHYLITGKDKKGNLEMEGGWQNNRPENGLHPKLRYVENIFEELDAEKEWFLDRKKNILYYKPAKEFSLTNAKVEVASLENFITLKGTEKNPVAYLSIDGFSFSRSIP